MNTSINMFNLLINKSLILAMCRNEKTIDSEIINDVSNELITV